MRAVCFDCDGTLLHFTRDYGAVLADAFDDVAGESRDEWIEHYDAAFHRYFAACEDRPVTRGFQDATPALDADALTDALLQREIEMVEPAPGVRDALETLAADGPVGVVTNGVPRWQRAKLAAHDLLAAVDVVVASYEAGAHKPDPAPFRLADARLGADDYVMVGDDDADVDGARNAGWTPHRYDGTGFRGLPERLD